MIVRILMGRVNPGQVASFRLHAQRVVGEIRKRDGLVHAQVGRQVHADGSEEIVFVSVWRDFESLYGWLGVTDLLGTPMQDRVECEVFERFEVQHYEVVELDDALAALVEESGSAVAARPRRAAVALDLGA